MLQNKFLRRFFRVCWCLLAAGVLAAVPVVVIDFKRQQYPVHYQAWFIAGMFVLLSLPVSIYEVAVHLEYFTRPKLQVKVIRILWMVPIYAVDSWLALRFKDTRVYFDSVRECYEAYVLYNFFAFLMAYLEEEYGDLEAYYCTKEPVRHLWPMNYCLRPWRMGEEFFWKCKQGVLGYVIARPLMTAAGLVADLVGVYGEGELRLDQVYPYTTTVNNITQCWALYCLVLFYEACHAELAPIRPLSKFIVVKAVIFLSFWQGVTVSLLAKLGLLNVPSYTTYDSDDVAAGLQEFAICIEMFFAALAHAYAFPPRDYMDMGARPRGGFVAGVRRMLDVRDVVDDVQLVMDETVHQTTNTVAEVGRATWATTTGAVKKVTDGPRNLVAMLGGGRGRGRRTGGGSDDEETGDNTHALLRYQSSEASLRDEERSGSQPGSPGSAAALAARMRARSRSSGSAGLERSESAERGDSS